MNRWQASVLILTAIVTLGAAGAAREHAMHAAPEPATMSGEEIVLPILHYGNRPQVEVLLNGKGPYRFILDTGAQSSVVGKALMEELGLPGCPSSAR